MALTFLALIFKRNTNTIIEIFLLSLIPIAFELINSTLENLIDKSYGTKYNEDVKHMKDMMSASVLVGLLIGYGGAVWLLLR